jgi:hypothetical protein
MKKSKKRQQKPAEFLTTCDCRSEVLRIEYDADIEMAEFAIYANNYRMSLWQKIRYVYAVLINGTPFADQTMLNKNQIKDLFLFLKSVL